MIVCEGWETSYVVDYFSWRTEHIIFYLCEQVKALPLDDDDLTCCWQRLGWLPSGCKLRKQWRLIHLFVFIANWWRRNTQSKTCLKSFWCKKQFHRRSAWLGDRISHLEEIALGQAWSWIAHHHHYHHHHYHRSLLLPAWKETSEYFDGWTCQNWVQPPRLSIPASQTLHLSSWCKSTRSNDCKLSFIFSSLSRSWIQHHRPMSQASPSVVSPSWRFVLSLTARLCRAMSHQRYLKSRYELIWITHIWPM